MCNRVRLEKGTKGGSHSASTGERVRRARAEEGRERVLLNLTAHINLRQRVSFRSK